MIFSTKTSLAIPSELSAEGLGTKQGARRTLEWTRAGREPLPCGAGHEKGRGGTASAGPTMCLWAAAWEMEQLPAKEVGRGMQGTA